jgi:hypothetical protein
LSLNDNTTNALGLEAPNIKPKKTVTISDYRRNNSESPELAKSGKTSSSSSSYFFKTLAFSILDPFYSTSNNRVNKTQPKKRSICKFSHSSDSSP